MKNGNIVVRERNPSDILPMNFNEECERSKKENISNNIPAYRMEDGSIVVRKGNHSDTLPMKFNEEFDF